MSILHVGVNKLNKAINTSQIFDSIWYYIDKKNMVIVPVLDRTVPIASYHEKHSQKPANVRMYQ